MDQDHSFGYWLKRYRLAHGLTQVKLAAKIGYSKSTIRKWESDTLRPAEAAAEKLAACLIDSPAERETFIREARDKLNTDQLTIPTRPIDRVPASLASGFKAAHTPIHTDQQMLPTGTVTFLFTDIEGSTKMWEQHTDAMRVALARHDSILRQVIGAYGGAVFKTVGDAFCAVFPTPSGALVAALDAQRALQAEEWGAAGPIRIRIALNTGAAEERDGDYFGPPVNRVARLRDAGHGGQTLLSLATAGLMRHQLPTGAELRNLGEHQLKDLNPAECIFQLVTPGLPTDFPPLRTQTIQAGARTLREPVADFVGREDEIAQLVQTLNHAADGATATIGAVRGMGGIGKTELAYAAARRLVPWFPDGEVLIELWGASHPMPAALALKTVIRAFNREAAEDGEIVDDLSHLQALYRTILAGKRVLIVADDARNAAQVRPLIPPAGCALLVTSRSRFSLPGMEAIDLGMLPPEEAEKLLLKVYPRIKAHAPKLAQLCGYLPLALRLSASLLANSSRTVARYLEQLDAERLKYLVDPDDPGASVEASLRLSYDALEPTAQHMLYQLSVFPTSFDQVAALTVVDVEGDTETLLDTLQRRCLLEWDTEIQRYRLHDLVRALVSSQFADIDNVSARHAQHYAQVADLAHWLYHQGGKATLAGLALFDREHAHFDAGWLWAHRHAGDHSADILLLRYGNGMAREGSLRHGNLRERLPQFVAVVEAARRLALRDAEMIALSNLGNVYYALKHVRRATKCHEQALAIAREIGNRQGEASALSNLGVAYQALGDTRQAIVYHEQSLDLMHEVGDRRREGKVLNNLGMAYQILGDACQAITYHERSLRIKREVGDRHGEGSTLTNLGIVYYNLGDARQALSYHEQALAIAREIDDRQREGGARNSLGLAYQALGDIHQALSYHEQALAIAREIGDRHGEESARDNLGVAYQALGDIHQALSYHEQALAIAREIGDRRREGIALDNLGLAYQALGDIHQALSYHEQALAIAREIGDRRREGIALNNLSASDIGLGELGRAVERGEQAQHILRVIGDRRNEGSTLHNLAHAHTALEHIDHAVEYHRQALAIRQAIGDERGAVQTRKALELLLPQ